MSKISLALQRAVDERTLQEAAHQMETSLVNWDARLVTKSAVCTVSTPTTSSNASNQASEPSAVERTTLASEMQAHEQVLAQTQARLIDLWQREAHARTLAVVEQELHAIEQITECLALSRERLSESWVRYHKRRQELASVQQRLRQRNESSTVKEPS